jgi:lipopolysaccharide export system permease protein
VSVSELDPDRRETTRWDAAEAWPDKSGGWIFKGGREIRFYPDTGENIASIPFVQTQIARFHEDPQVMLLIDQRPIDLSFFELRRLMAYFSQRNSPRGIPYAVRYYSLLADILAPLIVIAIAIPFSVAGVRVNPAVGVSKSIGLFFLYYILENVADLMATNQWIAPDLAAWLPNMSMAALAVWLFIRLR